MSYVFRAEGIGKSFGDRPVLTSASFWGEPGKIVSLMGRNGSGKTTLLRIAAGQLRADHGVIIYDDNASERPELARMARAGLFFVPQDQVLAHGFTVAAHLEALAGCFGGERVDEAVRRLQLDPLLHLTRAELSGGERMRASFALAFARRPRCLLIDEPLARMSPTDRENLAAALRGLADEGTAVVATGHEVRELLDLSDAIIWCVAGTTHHLGSAEEATGHHQFIREYLGPRGAGW